MKAVSESQAVAVSDAHQTSPFNTGAPPGARRANIGVSERSLLNLPEYTFLIDNGSGDVRAITTPDLGIPLTNPRPPGVPPPSVRHPAFFADFFKIPTLWGVKRTAPYFHDNSANTLEEVAAFLHEHVREQSGLPPAAHGSGRG